MQNYHLEGDNRFCIENYQDCRPFASFLPGIAGLMGKPLWVFYVNRGQAIASFGVKNKDEPILEFQPANRAYQSASSLGFRTFFRMRIGQRYDFYEPFRPATVPQKMIIGANDLYLFESNHKNGLQTEVVYFVLPGENLAGLVRLVTVTNQSKRSIGLEILDGLPMVVPFGVNNQILKDIGRTVEAWMEVYHLEQLVPYYHLRASVADSTEISSIDAGHFMLAFQAGVRESKILPAIVDPGLVFGQNTALGTPDLFYQKGLSEILSQKQITCGRTPCGFSASKVDLVPGESLHLNTIFGHVDCWEKIHSQMERLTQKGFLESKRCEANEIVRDLTDVIFCRTGSNTFDAYSRQTFLDNIMRGGWPIQFGTGSNSKVYHIYSRKHGDLERDYNPFSLAPEFFSQGNGNYRDVNQNRRDEIWFNPVIDDFNIRFFMSLIQVDGYNPLVIEGSRFTLPSARMHDLINYSNEPEKLRKILSGKFSPGSLSKDILDGSIDLKVDLQQFLDAAMEKSEQHFEASTGEGYWIDHWTYNLDLIESYLALYPDRQHELLFTENTYPFYDSGWIVLPRSEKYLLVNGKPTQMTSLVMDKQKTGMIAARSEEPNLLRTDHGMGSVYRTSLFAKLIFLALIKFATLDPWGMGIEMEAGRPGWDDALNGLPGLFGSSLAETLALKRLVGFLRNVLKAGNSGGLSLPVEADRLLYQVKKDLERYSSAKTEDRDYLYWDRVSSAREHFRDSVRLGLDGAEKDLAFIELAAILALCERKIDDGINRAITLNNGLPPTFFTYRVEEFEFITDKKKQQKKDSLGRPYIHARRFTPIPLPLFLEGMARMMRITDLAASRHLYEQVKLSGLYDRKLKMYKINESLANWPKDIGRVRAFTPGWLENESIWLHMEYKYLLEILRSGLYEQFFNDLKSILIPFLDPKKYGRSILENSSFLVSSVHPDKSLHGAGFVARLSGACAEFLSMWRMMMAGERPFFVKDSQLCLSFKPILPGWLFSKDNTVSFKFLGKTMVTYLNPDRRDTFDSEVSVRSIKIQLFDEKAIEYQGSVIPAPYAEQVRDGNVKQIDIYLA